MQRKFTLFDFSMAIALAAIWIFFYLNTHAFFSPRNLSMLAIELSITAVLSLGVFSCSFHGRSICPWAAASV